MERYIGHEPEVVERLQPILRNARDIKQVDPEGRPDDGARARPSRSSSRSRAAAVLRGRRVLVVDADESVRSAAHDLLERYGCIVETAHDGGEAQFMVRNLATEQQLRRDHRRHPPAGHDRLRAAAQAQGDDGTGADGPDDRLRLRPGAFDRQARQAGLQAVLYKPFRLDQLLETVELLVTGCRPPALPPILDPPDDLPRASRGCRRPRHFLGRDRQPSPRPGHPSPLDGSRMMLVRGGDGCVAAGDRVFFFGRKGAAAFAAGSGIALHAAWAYVYFSAAWWRFPRHHRAWHALHPDAAARWNRTTRSRVDLSHNTSPS